MACLWSFIQLAFGRSESRIQIPNPQSLFPNVINGNLLGLHLYYSLSLL